MTMKQTVCNYCKKKIKRFPCKIRKINFCNKKCLSSWYKLKRKSITCNNCGKKIDIIHAKIKNHNYCSNACYHLSRRNNRIINKIPTKGELIEQYVKQNRTLKEIGKCYGLARETTYFYIKKYNISYEKKWSLTKINKRQTFFLGYVVGAIFGDGWFYKKAYRTYFCSTELSSISVFMSMLSEIYPGCFRIRTQERPNVKILYTIEIPCKALYEFLSPYKEKSRFFIPDFLNTKESKAGFLSGFFDAEGCIQIYNNRLASLYISSKYYENLIPIQKMLTEFGIESKLNRVKTRMESRIYLGQNYENLKKIKKNINFHSFKKMKTLEDAICLKQQ